MSGPNLQYDPVEVAALDPEAMTKPFRTRSTRSPARATWSN